MTELFNSSQFSSKNDALRDFELEEVSSKKKTVKRSHVSDPAWDNDSAFPEVSSKNIFFSQGETLKAIEEKGLVDGAAPLPKDFDSFKEFEVAWKDWIVKQTGTSEEELCCVSASYVWEKELSTIKDDNDNESDRPKSQVETKTAPKSKASDCWYTPPEIITLIQQCLDGITLDPYSDERKHIEACRHLTALDNGLSHQWSGRVFMNPPYSCPGVWISKLQEEFNCGRVEEAMPAAGFAYALVPVATDTKWFHPLISSNLICFWKGRIKFLDVNYQPKMPARQSHALIYWGKNQSRFRQIFSSFGTFNSSEQKGAIECNSHNLTSAQELVQDSVTLACNSDLTSLELPKQTNTVAISSSIDTQESITTDACEASPLTEDSDLNREQSTSLQLLPPVPLSLEKGLDLVQQTTEIVSPQSCELSTTINQNSQPLKTLPGCLTAPHTQESQPAHISEAYSEPLTASGTMRNGLLWELDTLEVPLLEKESCWLPSPGALSSTGKGRPPGQTKQEGELKKLGLLQKNEVLNPAILCQWYGIPQTWLDPSESRAATELLENNERQQEICLTPELQRSPSVESCTCNQLQSSPTPENFLEENTADTKQLPSQKRRQRKGCLYKYLENKKLKNGNIASYPRVIGETRDPDNPKHWRWGFNWEEKIDGEWKGRSIGSVPLGAIALIQSMQKESVSLEEIIGFIRRAKNKV